MPTGRGAGTPKHSPPRLSVPLPPSLVGAGANELPPEALASFRLAQGHMKSPGRRERENEDPPAPHLSEGFLSLALGGRMGLLVCPTVKAKVLETCWG